MVAWEWWSGLRIWRWSMLFGYDVRYFLQCVALFRIGFIFLITCCRFCQVGQLTWGKWKIVVIESLVLHLVAGLSWKQAGRWFGSAHIWPSKAPGMASGIHSILHPQKYRVLGSGQAMARKRKYLGLKHSKGSSLREADMRGKCMEWCSG